MSWPSLNPNTQTFAVGASEAENAAAPMSPDSKRLQAGAATLDNLLRAIREGQSEHVGRLLGAAPALVSTTSDDRQTPLHHAAEAGCAAAIRLLLDAGAASDAVDSDGQTALHVAVANQQLECAHALTSRARPCRELGVTDNFRMTPLHIAAENGEAPMVQLLICRGAMVNEARPSQKELLASTDAGGVTPKTRVAQLKADAPPESPGAGASSPASSRCSFSGDGEVHRGFAAPSSPEFSRKALLQKSQKDSGGTALFLALQHEHNDVAELIRRAADGEAIGMPACLAHLQGK